VCAPSYSRTQQDYVDIANWIDRHNNRVREEDKKIIFHAFSGLPPIEIREGLWEIWGRDRETPRLIILDDLMGTVSRPSRADHDFLSRCFVSGRHVNLSTYEALQSWASGPLAREQRLQNTDLLIFGYPDFRSIYTLIRQVSEDDETAREGYDMWREAVEEKPRGGHLHIRMSEEPRFSKD
jgi:hypothetical protein